MAPDTMVAAAAAKAAWKKKNVAGDRLRACGGGRVLDVLDAEAEAEPAAEQLVAAEADAVADEGEGQHAAPCRP